MAPRVTRKRSLDLLFSFMSLDVHKRFSGPEGKRGFPAGPVELQSVHPACDHDPTRYLVRFNSFIMTPKSFSSFAICFCAASGVPG